MIPVIANNKTALVVVIAFCGITDFLDGFIARKNGLETTIGAKLDSLGDFIFFITISVYAIKWQSCSIIKI